MKNAKKLLILLLSIIILTTISGCVTYTYYDIDDNERNNLFNSMQSQGIVNDDFTFVETFKRSGGWAFSVTVRIYYVYEDANENYIAILYSDNNDEIDYEISVYDVSLTGANEYEINENIGHYHVTEESRIVLFWTFRDYLFELQ